MQEFTDRLALQTLIGADANPEWRIAPEKMFAGHPGRLSSSDV